MKNISALILALLLTFALVACGEENPTTGSTDAGVNNATNPSSTAPSTDPSQTQPSAPDHTRPTETEPQPTEHKHRHTMAVNKEPTCDEPGEATYTCECGDTFVSPLNPTGHTYTSEKTKDETCAAEGEMTYTCHCGHSYVESIPSPSHEWGDWTETVRPSMTAKGEAQRTCYHCGNTESMELGTRTMEQELSIYASLAAGLPIYQSIDELSANFLFQWLSFTAKPISSEWNDETFQITKIYGISDLDECTLYYFGRTFDYDYLVECNEELSFNEDYTQLIWVTYGAGGGPYTELLSYEQLDETHYSLRYIERLPGEEGESFGSLTLHLVDGRFIIESHTKG